MIALSWSRISDFRQCPAKFKFKYIDFSGFGWYSHCYEYLLKEWIYLGGLEK